MDEGDRRRGRGRRRKGEKRKKEEEEKRGERERERRSTFPISPSFLPRIENEESKEGDSLCKHSTCLCSVASSSSPKVWKLGRVGGRGEGSGEKNKKKETVEIL